MTAAKEAGLGRGRRIAIWTLIILATLIAFLSCVTLWVERQLLDNKAWTNASAKVIQDPQVQSTLAIYLSDQLYTKVDVAGAVGEKLPPNLQPLAGPLEGALRSTTPRAIEYILQRPRLQQVFITASSAAHQKLVNVLENKTGYGISTGNGEVTIDLSEMVKEVGQALGVPASALQKVPSDAGQVTLMSSDKLSLAQKGVRLIRVLSVWLLALVLVMYVLAVVLARGYRREVLRRVGWSILVVGVLVLVVKKLVGNYVINGLTPLEYREVGRHVWLVLTEIMGQIGIAGIFYGLLLVLGAALAGPTRAARWIRNAVAPVLNDRLGISWGGAAVVLLLLVYWGPTHALRTWWGILIFGGLMAEGLVALRHQTLAEAKARPAAVAAASPQPAAEAAGVSPAPGRSPAEEIARLHSLLDEGAITPEEFERAKAIALS